MKIYEVAILGGGAAGLMAAIAAGERGRSTIVLEKNRRPGVKILMSGGTRCNITNARGLHDLSVVSGPIDPAYDYSLARGARSVMDAFAPDGKFLGAALREFDVAATVCFFESEGVRTKIEANGKIFPVSDRASDVLAALVRKVERAGVEIRTNHAALDIESVSNRFQIRCSEGDVEAERVIVAVGGRSYPGCGTTGDGYAWARKFGHSIVEPRPALVPLSLQDPRWTSLKGVTLTDVKASVQIAGKVVDERREAVLFAHFGVTGPAILDISRAIARSDGSERAALVLDLLPELSIEALDSQIRERARSGKRGVASLIPDSIPRRVADELIDYAGIPYNRTGADLSRDERKRLVAAIKSLELVIAGTTGFAKAEVTRGGVTLSEIDPRTCESKLCERFYVVGEALDLDGRIGGYNFQAAFSTGRLAGRFE
jgi:predicted Rossmann fold flavoprotein